MKIQVSVFFLLFFKFNIRPPKCFLVLMLYLILDGLILFCKGDFHHVRMTFKGRILGNALLWEGGGIPTPTVLPCCLIQTNTHPSLYSPNYHY